MSSHFPLLKEMVNFCKSFALKVLRKLFQILSLLNCSTPTYLRVDTSEPGTLSQDRPSNV